MRLIIVRHGETIENLQGVCQGQMDGTLSANGLRQVKSTADRLQNERINIIFSSDLKRAIDTSKEIHKYHSHIPLMIDTRLRERYFGSFQGKIFPLNKKDQILPKDSESDAELYLRVADFYREIISKHIEQTVLIVSHGITIRMLLATIQNLPSSSIKSIEELKNSSITLIEINHNKSPKIIIYNSIEHLNI